MAYHRASGETRPVMYNLTADGQESIYRLYLYAKHLIRPKQFFSAQILR